MVAEQKERILKQVGVALEQVPYGKIIVELKGPDRPVDVVVENRVRFADPTRPPMENRPKPPRNYQREG